MFVTRHPRTDAVRDAGSVYVRMTLTTPMCPVAETLPPEVEAQDSIESRVLTALDFGGDAAIRSSRTGLIFCKKAGTSGMRIYHAYGLSISWAK